MKRKKMILSDFELLKIDYHASQRVKHSTYGYGTRFILDKPLNDAQITAIIRFRNTLVGNCYHKYAPEIKYNTLTLYDKCI